MKFFPLVFLSSKNAFSHLLLLALVSGSICLSSCEDDMDRPLPSSHISFTSEISSSWTPSTRFTTNADAPQGTVTTLQGGNTPLYLHTFYTDSIASPSLDIRSDTAVLTRATPVTDTNMYNTFGVSAYSYTGSWDEESKTPNYFHNATVSKSGDDGYLLSSTYYWPGASYNMKFFAYAPKDNSQYVLSNRTQAGSPTISVTVPSSVDDQKDLLVAKTDELAGNTNTAVALTFNHALTAIKFVCGDDMQGGTVKSVSLKNVYSKGTYNMGTQSWSVQGTPTTFSQVLNKSTTGTANDPLTTDAQTFMMVPQTLPDEAQLEVVFTDNSNTDHTLTADIKGTSWPMGKTVTYKISNTSINWTYTLNVTAPADFTYTGGTQQYSVTSYRQNTKGVKEAVQWSAQYSTDNGASWTAVQPDWLTAFTASGVGGVTPQSYNATVSAQTSTSSNSHTIALQNAPAKGSADTPYNLANQTDGGTTNENTANCYVVNAPGYYSFPLVYGNAIKNSATNKSAYQTSNTGKDRLITFINHTGDGITNPYISRNANCTPSKAELLWQDALNLVSEIKYNNIDNGNISFKVDKSFIQQGNAVIVIKNASGKVLWSWHIWVTDEDINKTIEVTNYQNKKYNIMPVHLGWCDGYTVTYAERSCKVRFTAGNQSQEITVKQAAGSTRTKSTYPYYQWGRKDPFLPSNGSDEINNNKTWYDKNGTPFTNAPAKENLSTGATCIKKYILKPNVMHEDRGGDRLYCNLWNIAHKGYFSQQGEVIKTIYDPSPVGFKVPDIYAFTGFTTTGETTSDRSKINGIRNKALKGWDFYTNSSKNETIFFLLAGYRSCSKDNVYHIGTYGYSWLSFTDYKDSGCATIYSLTHVTPCDNFERGFGYGVRCSQE